MSYTVTFNSFLTTLINVRSVTTPYQAANYANKRHSDKGRVTRVKDNMTKIVTLVEDEDNE